MTDDEERRLLDACLELRFHDPGRGHLWQTFLYLLATTGCRRGEVLRLEWGRIDLDGAFIKLVSTKTKRQRLQPLVGEAVMMLRRIRSSVPKMVCDGKEVPKESLVFRPLRCNIKRVFDRIRKKAGVPHARIRDLRSTVGSDTANSGFDVSQAGDFLGHADYRTTRRHYVRRELENKRLVAEALAARLRSALRSAFRSASRILEVAVMNVVGVSYQAAKGYIEALVAQSG